MPLNLSSASTYHFQGLFHPCVRPRHLHSQFSLLSFTFLFLSLSVSFSFVFFPLPSSSLLTLVLSFPRQSLHLQIIVILAMEEFVFIHDTGFTVKIHSPGLDPFEIQVHHPPPSRAGRGFSSIDEILISLSPSLIPGELNGTFSGNS